MKIPAFILEPFANWAIGKLRSGKLKPHKYGHIENAAGELYMARGWLLEPRWWTLGWGARIHHTVRSDDDRALHDHPWFNVSVILRGWYYELVPLDAENPRWLINGDEACFSHRRMPGEVIARQATDRHRLIVPPGEGCYSLFIVGPRRQAWGFYPPGGKVEWRTYLGLPPKNEGETH